MNEERQPTCPACGYDLVGIITEDERVNCPECGNPSTYKQALEVCAPPKTIKHALLGVLVIPSSLGIPLCLMLFITGAPLDSFILAPFVFLYLTTYTAVLLIREHKHRRRFSSIARQTPWATLLMLVLACFSVSAFVWYTVMRICVEIISVI